MNLQISKSRGGQLLLQPVVPAGVVPVEMPGITSWSHESSEGLVFVEEFHSGPFTIRFILFHFVQKMSLFFKEHLPVRRVRLVKQGSWTIKTSSGNVLRMKENQLLFYDVPEHAELINIEKDHVLRCVDTQCSMEKARSFIPSLPAFSYDSPLLPVVSWSNPLINEVMFNIEHCTFTSPLREYYIEHKLEELFILLFEQTLQSPRVRLAAPSVRDVAAVQRLERMILADLSRHYSIPVLSRMAGMNEFDLKRNFKLVVGEGIFEHLLRHRMQQAYQLVVNTDKPIKEIAGITGYKFVSSFVTAFGKFHGMPPGSLRRHH